MTTEVLLVFIPACFALNLTFGPSNLLALLNGAQRGVRFAMVAGLGRLAVFAPMIGVVAVGLGSLLATSAIAFTVVKIAGAAFLMWIGARMVISALRQPGRIGGRTAEPAGTMARAFRTEAITAGGNPKAILIFAAFLPQFVPASAGPAAFIEVGALFLLLEFCAIAVYASVGAVASLKLAARGARWITGMSGIGMIGFGAALAFVEAPAQRR